MFVQCKGRPLGECAFYTSYNVFIPLQPECTPSCGSYEAQKIKHASLKCSMPTRQNSMLS